MQVNSLFFGDQININVHIGKSTALLTSTRSAETLSNVQSLCTDGDILSVEDCFTIVDISDRNCVSTVRKQLRVGDQFLLADGNGKTVSLSNRGMLVANGSNTTDALFSFAVPGGHTTTLSYDTKEISLVLVSSANAVIETTSVVLSENRFYASNTPALPEYKPVSISVTSAQTSPVEYKAAGVTHRKAWGAIAMFEDLTSSDELVVSIDDIGKVTIPINTLSTPPLALIGCTQLSTNEVYTKDISINNASVTLSYMCSGMVRPRANHKLGFKGRFAIYLVMLLIVTAYVLHLTLPIIVHHPEHYLSVEGLQMAHNPVRNGIEAMIVLFVLIFHRDLYMRRTAGYTARTSEPVVWVVHASKPVGLGTVIRGRGMRIPNTPMKPIITNANTSTSNVEIPKPIFEETSSGESSVTYQEPANTSARRLPTTPGPRKGAKLAPPKQTVSQAAEAAMAIAGCIAFGQQLINPSAESIPSSIQLSEQTSAALRRTLPQDLKQLRNAVYTTGPSTLRISVKSYAPVQFAEQRKSHGVSDQEQYDSFKYVNPEMVHGDQAVHHALVGLALGCSEGMYNIHFLDQTEVHDLLDIAPSYLDFLHHQPKSLLTRYLGIFRVQVNDKQEQYIGLVGKQTSSVYAHQEFLLRLKYDGYKRDSACVHQTITKIMFESELERVFNIHAQHRDRVVQLLLADIEFLRRHDKCGYSLVCCSNSGEDVKASQHSTVVPSPSGDESFCFEVAFLPMTTSNKTADKYARAFKDYVDVVIPATSSIIVTSWDQFVSLIGADENQLRSMLPTPALDALDAKPSPGALVVGTKGEKYIVPPRGGIKQVL